MKIVYALLGGPANFFGGRVDILALHSSEEIMSRSCLQCIMRRGSYPTCAPLDFGDCCSPQRLFGFTAETVPGVELVVLVVFRQRFLFFNPN